jgi:hypothetical protein
MEIAAILNVHTYNSVFQDTLESVFAYVTDDTLIVVDGIAWDQFKGVDLKVPKLWGFCHGVPHSPYRNVALGLDMAYRTWGDKDWYVYLEHDVLFASTRYAYNLKMAEERGVWMLGFCGRIDEKEMPLIDSMIGEPLKSNYYLLGCCLFFHRNFIAKLSEINFFERFLNLTNGFEEGYFPAYDGYDVSEHLYPSLCRHFGGHIGVLSTWDENEKWHGSHEYFPVRWRPELDPEKDPYEKGSILHPLKNPNSFIREFHRERRQVWSLTHGTQKFLV